MTEFVALAPRDKPPGNAPDATDQVNGAVPPVASTVAVYAELMLPEGSDVVVTEGTSDFEGVPEQPATIRQQYATSPIRAEKAVCLAIEITQSI